MRPDVLPAPEPPAGVLLLYEHAAVDPSEWLGNYRFAVREDGAFLHQHNTRSEGSGTWDAVLPDEPVARIDAAGMARLRDALAAADIPREAAQPRDLATEESNPILQRFTIAGSDRRLVSATFGRALPAPVAALRETVDDVLSAALRERDR